MRTSGQPLQDTREFRGPETNEVLGVLGTADLLSYLHQKGPYRHCDKVSGTNRLSTSADAAEALALGLKRAVAARKLLSEEAAAVVGHRVVRDRGAVPEVYESPAAALLRDFGVRRNKNKTYLECRFIAPEQKAAKQILASIERSNAPKGQRSVRDILNITISCMICLAR